MLRIGFSRASALQVSQVVSGLLWAPFLPNLLHLWVHEAAAGPNLPLSCVDFQPVEWSPILTLSFPLELSFTSLAKQILLPLLMITLMLALELMCLPQQHHYHYLCSRYLAVAAAGSDVKWWQHLMPMMRSRGCFCEQCSHWENWGRFFIQPHYVVKYEELKYIFDSRNITHWVLH